MKNTWMNTMIAAAALAVAAGSTASAQTFRAEVPMAFQIAGKTMEAGSYDVRVANGDHLVVVRNRATHESALVAKGAQADAPKAWVDAGEPMIAFECANGSCSLRKLWVGASSAYVFPGPKAPSGNVVASRTEVVTLALVRAR
jgi:hypothetical protein